MKNILLACNLGMSTSALVVRMDNAAQAKDLEVQIAALSIHEAERLIDEWDIILLGPQVRHHYKDLKAKVAGRIPVEIIDMRDYGMMNGEKVLNAALKALDDFHK